VLPVWSTSIDTPDLRLFYTDAGHLREQLALGGFGPKTNSANALIESHQAMGFVMAVTDLVQSVYACPTPWDRMSGVFSTTETYLDEHPELAKQSAAKVVVDALRAKYPCPRRSTR
jgi:hypothetical protein